jgi:hypothetical protein
MSSEKIEAFWENATADDVARVMAGETVEARFWDDDMQGWTTRTLSGWQTTGVRPLWHSSEGFVWTRCQVYREPSWWTDKPDPGPGFRLLEKFPDEELKPGDDAWDVWNDKQWRMSDSANGRLPQGKDIWYRRRLEPVEPVEPDVLHYVLLAGESASLPNGQTITITEKGFEVTQ